jgi:hypothetical protein
MGSRVFMAKGDDDMEVNGPQNDPPWNSTHGMSPRGHFLVSLSYLARSLDRIWTPVM